MKLKNTMFTIPEKTRPLALQQALAQHLKLSGRGAKRMLDDRRVLVNGKRVWMARHQLRGGERIEIIPSEKPERKDIGVLYRDAQLVVADKPAGMLSNGEDSLESRLRKQLDLPALRAVHRLDRHTSGCLLLTASKAIYAAMVEQFRQRRILKIYHTIVLGKWVSPDKQLRSHLDGLDAITNVRLLDSSSTASHLAIRIETGRTHQIRRHLALAGFPVLGDREHGKQRFQDPRLRAIPRQMLHNTVLEFDHPLESRRVRASSRLPADFTACLHAFRLT